MGVPISREILTRCWRPSNADLCPYFYEGTTMDEYNSALAVESTGCCVTKIEYAKSNGIEKTILRFLILLIQWIHWLHEFVFYRNLYSKRICLKWTGNRWCRSYFWYFEGCRELSEFGYTPETKNKITFWNSWHFTKPESIQRHRFISITSNTKNHDSIEKATKLSDVVYNTWCKKTLLTLLITF